LENLGNLLQGTPPRINQGRPRLPVDRIFSIAGFGTVVTGTLSDGNLTSGDEVEILPSGLRGRIRGLQTHKKKEETAVPGSRTAVNISGLDVHQIKRGELVAHPGQYHTSQRLDLSIRMLPGVSTPLRHHTEVKFYIGTSETVANVRLLGVESLDSEETGWLQLELQTPVVAVRGDRYILRRPSPAETIGGGMVVDPQPKGRHKRFDNTVLQVLIAMAQGSPAEVLLQASLALGLAPVKDIISHSQLEKSVADSALRELIGTGQCLLLEDFLIPALFWTNLKESAVTALSAYHEVHPLRHGMPREELKSRLSLGPHTFNLILPKLVSEGVLVEDAKWVALPSHKVIFSPFQRVKVDHLLELFELTPSTPPSVKECLTEVGEDIFSALRESGELVAVSEDVVFWKDEYESMVVQIQQNLIIRGQITMAEVRDLLKTTRKYAQPLLEHLDSIGVTIREGDFRRLRNKEK
jgi:selenocysteine-specific elongation factor